MGSLFAIFFQINKSMKFLSSVHKGKKPNNNFSKISSENF